VLQPLLQLRQPHPLGRHRLRRARQVGVQPVQALRLGVEPVTQPTLQAFGPRLQLGQPLRLRRAHQFGRRRGCGRPQVGHEVGDGEIGFVPDAADHRHRAGGDGARQRLVVESPQVLDRAAAAHQQDEVDRRRPRVACQIGLRRLSRLRQQIQFL